MKLSWLISSRWTDQHNHGHSSPPHREFNTDDPPSGQPLRNLVRGSHGFIAGFACLDQRGVGWAKRAH